jgi:tRNA-2-methylthio-N6-dimethylallyladenosine synthase
VHFDPVVSTGSTTAGPTTAGSTTDGSADTAPIRPGDMVTVEITRAAPHHLVADGGVLAVRRTRSGDAWQARTAAPAAPVVGLGMPKVGAPA